MCEVKIFEKRVCCIFKPVVTWFRDWGVASVIVIMVIGIFSYTWSMFCFVLFLFFVCVCFVFCFLSTDGIHFGLKVDFKQ